MALIVQKYGGTSVGDTDPIKLQAHGVWHGGLRAGTESKGAKQPPAWVFLRQRYCSNLNQALIV